jgi:hypothetical protein
MSQLCKNFTTHSIPKWLRNGIDKSLEIDHLSRAFLVVDEKPHYWRIIKGTPGNGAVDIPYFSACPGSDELVLEPGSLLQSISRSQVTKLCRLS